MKGVRFDRYGDIEVLHVADVPVPEPATTPAVTRALRRTSWSLAYQHSA